MTIDAPSPARFPVEHPRNTGALSAYREFFPIDPPARTVCGAGLIGGHKVEIECVALV